MIRFINLTDHAWKTRVFVNEYIMKDMEYKPADKVTFYCNDEIKSLTPGGWTDCEIQPQKDAYFMITTADFKNGADGASETE